MPPCPHLFTSDNAPNGKVCRNILLVEFISERRAGGSFPVSPEWFPRVGCFRLSLSPGNSEVIVTKVSRFDTFEVEYVGSPSSFISDHSGKYYAVYSEAAALLQIWDIETGEMIRRIPKTEIPKMRYITEVLVIAKQGPDGPQQVVVAGGLTSAPPWAQGWGNAENTSLTDFAIYPIQAASPDWTACIEEFKKQQGESSCPPREAFFLADLFKVPRCPAGITSLDAPDTPGYLSEEIGLALWNMGAGNVHSFYSTITPDRPPIIAPDVPLAVEREFRMAIKGNPRYLPFAVGSRSGLSLTIDFTGRCEEFEGLREKLYRLCVRSFYPSATPRVMDLEWESHLRSSSDRRETRRIFFTNTNVMNRDPSPYLLIDENELGTAFLEAVQGRALELVLLLWDDKFHGELPLGGRVLN